MQNGSEQAHFTMGAAIGTDRAQATLGLRVGAQKLTADDGQQQQRNRDQRKHSRISLRVGDVSVFQAEQMFGVAKAALAAPAARVLLSRLKGRIVAIADQMPDAPTPLAIAGAALGDESRRGERSQ
jgi:hypothetical protein